MEKLIDLTSCIIEDQTELKRASLKAFIFEYDNYDVKKISRSLNVPISTVQDWIFEFKQKETDPINERVILFKKINPKSSQRDIAKHFGISVGSVNKYLKNLQE